MTTAVRRCPLLAPTVLRYSSGLPPILLPVSRWMVRATPMKICAIGPLGGPFAPRVPPGGTSTAMRIRSQLADRTSCPGPEHRSGAAVRVGARGEQSVAHRRGTEGQQAAADVVDHRLVPLAQALE